MKASHTELLRFLQSPNRFCVPRYQRRYRWTTRDCSRLYDDIIAVAKSTSKSIHFLGSVVYVIEGDYSATETARLVLIDGQQRLTTVSILLAAIAAVAVDAKAMSADESERKLRNTYLINSNDLGSERYKIEHSELDRQLYRAIIDGRYDEVRSIASPVVENYRWFENKLRKEKSYLEVLSGLGRMMIIDTSLSLADDNPQRTFQSINDTGRPLTDFDKIRNFFFMNLLFEEAEDVYARYWSVLEQGISTLDSISVVTYLREFLALKTGNKPEKSNLYGAFVQFRESCAETPSATVAAEMVEQLTYYKIAHKGDLLPLSMSSEALQRAISDLNGMGGDQFVGLTMATVSGYLLGKLSEVDAIHIVRLFESFLVRRYLCKVPTNSVNKVVVKMLSELLRCGTITALLVERVFAEQSENQRFPSNEEVLRDSKMRDLYASQNSNLFHLLKKIANFGARETVESNEFTIEHVMPREENVWWKSALGEAYDDIKSRYLNKLSNLTLTAFNRELGTKSFHEKKALFSQSPFPLNKWIAQQEEWSAEVMDRRADMLADRIINVFPALGASVENAVQPFTIIVERDAMKSKLATALSQKIGDSAFSLVDQMARFVEDDSRLTLDYFDEGVLVNLSSKSLFSIRRNGEVVVFFGEIATFEPFESVESRQDLRDKITEISHEAIPEDALIGSIIFSVERLAARSHLTHFLSLMGQVSRLTFPEIDTGQEQDAVLDGS